MRCHVPKIEESVVLCLILENSKTAFDGGLKSQSYLNLLLQHKLLK